MSIATERWAQEGHFFPYKTNNVIIVEIFAICAALETALSQIRDLQSTAEQSEDEIHQPTQSRGKVTVFSDSIDALQLIDSYYPSTGSRNLSQKARAFYYRGEIQTVFKHTHELCRLGVQVELHLVPGHNYIPGNVQAHQ